MNKQFTLTLIGIFLVLISAIIPVGNNLWYPQFITMYALLSIGIALKVWEMNKPLAIFNLICLFSAMFVTRAILVPSPKGMVLLGHINLCSLAVYVISKFDKKQRKALLWGIVGLVALQGIYIIIQYFNLDPIFDKIVDRSLDDAIGFTGSHNQSGLFFSVTTPAVIYLCPYLLPFVVFGLWCSTTSTSWIAFMIGSIATAHLLRKKYTFWLVGVALAGTIVFFWGFESLSKMVIVERELLIRQTVEQVVTGKAYVEQEGIEKYKVIVNGREIVDRGQQGAYHVITCNPLLGYGLGNFMKISPFTQSNLIHHTFQHRYFHAHNDFIETFFELGYTGALVILLFLGSIIRRFFMARRTKILIVSFCAIAVHGINALGIFTVHTAVSGMLLVLFLGLFFGELREQEHGPVTEVV